MNNLQPNNKEITSAKKLRNDVRIPKLRFKEFDDEWNKTKIGNILTIGSGRDYKHLNSGNIPVYGTGGLMTHVDKYLYDGESIGIGRKGTIDKPVYLNEKFWTVDTLFYTHSFINSVPKFVFSLFQKINWKLYNEASGVPSLSKKTIENIKINLPSLKEQQKIATFLTAVDTKLQQLNKKKELLSNYKKGVMQQLFPSSSSGQVQLRFKNDDGSDFSDWEEKKLGEVARIITGSTPSTSNKDYYGGVKLFVSPADIQGNKYVFNTKTTLTELGFKKGRIVKKNSVIFVCIGSTIGKVAQLSEDSLTNQQINSLEANQQNSNDFIYAVLSFYGKKIKLLAGVQAVPQINKTEFSNLKFKFPSLKEQQKIANYLSAIDNKITNVQTQIDKTQAFKKGLLQQMFV